MYCRVFPRAGPDDGQACPGQRVIIELILRDCAPRNLEIPNVMLTHRPETTEDHYEYGLISFCCSAEWRARRSMKVRTLAEG